MRRYPPILIISAVACAAAAILFGTAFVGALSVEPLPPAAPAISDSAAVDSPRALRQLTPLTNDALMLAVDSDPFRPERQRSPERYRLPGEELPAMPEEPPPPPPAPPFRLIGTAITPAGGLAVIEIEGNTRVVDVGESLLGYTLAEVDAERATMVGPQRTVHLPLVAMETDDAGGGNRSRQERGRGRSEEEARDAARNAAREMVERIRQSGGNITPQMLQMLQRLQQEGRDVEVQVAPGQGGRMMIRTRRDTTDMTTPSASFHR